MSFISDTQLVNVMGYTIPCKYVNLSGQALKDVLLFSRCVLLLVSFNMYDIAFVITVQLKSSHLTLNSSPAVDHESSRADSILHSHVIFNYINLSPV